MNARKTLENRIKGWFPQEPTLNNGIQETKSTFPKRPPTIRERLVGGLGASGGGLIFMGLFFYFMPNYPKQANLAMVVTGISLLAAALLVRRTYKH